VKKTLATSSKLFLAVLAVLALAVPAAQARDRGNNGAGSLEFTVPINYTSSTNITGQNGSSADINAALSTGFGMGYNINDNFQINGTFSWGNRNYSAVTTPTGGSTVTNYNGTLNTSSLQMNAVYYFMAGDFTPFVSGGFGTTYIDSNIPNGGSSSSCYWDPYWGYVCGTYVPTKTSNNISYSAGLGARMDISRNFALQGSINRMWIDAAQAGSKPEFDSFRIDFVFRM
jgi:opacity protein-like surface antigen